MIACGFIFLLEGDPGAAAETAVVPEEPAEHDQGGRG